METAMQHLELSVPKSDMAFFLKLANKMGWIVEKKISGIEKGLEDIRRGNVYTAENPDDLIKQILG